jgi:acetyltransferase-like isoleucine patch superfamily enzyme
VIHEDVVLGKGISIGNHVTIYPGIIIGDDVTILDNSVIGRPPLPSKSSTTKVNPMLEPLRIGKGTIVGACTVLYKGSTIGCDVMIGDQAFIRESCEIRDHVVVSRGVSVENQVKIGAHTKIQTDAYITAYTTLEERVFIAPTVTTTNDNFMGRTEERFQFVKGPTVKRGARVGGGSILLPGVTIGEESFIAAGAVVNKDTQEGKVYVGVPAKELRDIPEKEKLRD